MANATYEESISSAKELFFNQSVDHKLLTALDEKKWFNQYDLVLRSWIAQLIMIPYAFEYLVQDLDDEWVANHPDKTTDHLSIPAAPQGDLITLIRRRYPCTRKLHQVTESLKQNENISSEIITGLTLSETQLKRITEYIVKHNTRLVVKLAKQYNFLKLPLMDMIQEGFFGLLIAIEKFDINLNNRFSTYAWWWIKQSIVAYTRKQGGVVRRPEGLVDLIIKTSGITDKYDGKITPEIIRELSNELDCSEESLTEAIRQNHADLSIDYLSHENEHSYHWQHRYLKDKWDEPLATPLQIEKVLDAIPSRLRQVMVLKYGLHDRTPLTNREIGEVIGVGGERVRQLLETALFRLKDSMDRQH